MGNKQQATIIGYGENAERICAGAARISTTHGDAIEIFDNSVNEEKNKKLIRNVLNSGHESFLEHANFTIAFRNVSAFFEQFMIEFRLAAFTVKSRRYVNFGEMGFYTPDNMPDFVRERYNNHMSYLFSEYNFLVENGVPIEDARFVLPYSFYSNFYCTVNARELVHVLRDMIFGRGKDYCEIQNIAKELVSQLEDTFPVVVRETYKPYDKCELQIDECSLGKAQQVRPFVDLVAAPDKPLQRILKAYSLTRGGMGETHGVDDCLDLLQDIVVSARPRELEQISYSFLINNLSLSGITHIVRHRMQSIVIPPLSSVDILRYIVPDTVAKRADLLARYNDVFRRTYDVSTALCAEDNRFNKVYFNLSGNTLNVMTTINTRELLHIIKLRSCNRAQWEIRDVACEMLELARSDFPELFKHYGPSCVVDKKCPEGKLSCGHMNEVLLKFS